MSNDNKLDLIMKMIAENREEMHSEFKNINNKIDYLTEQTQIVKVTSDEEFIIIEGIGITLIR